MSGVVTIVQARLGSTRLPGKVLLPLAGRPALARMVERVASAHLAGRIVVATTTLPEDDAVAAFCATEGIDVFRGHPTDLLDRHVAAARSYGARHVVKIPSDCPLIDPAAIDRVLERYLAAREAYDYVSNLHPPSWPDGNDVEVMPLAVLETARREATRPEQREHTTPFLWDQPERFRIGNVVREYGPDLSKAVRLTLDYREDYELIARIFEAFRPKTVFGTEEIVTFLERHPDVASLNARYRGVNWYRNHLDTLRTVSAADTRAPEAAA